MSKERETSESKIERLKTKFDRPKILIPSFIIFTIFPFVFSIWGFIVYGVENTQQDIGECPVSTISILALIMSILELVEALGSFLPLIGVLIDYYWFHNPKKFKFRYWSTFLLPFTTLATTAVVTTIMAYVWHPECNLDDSQTVLVKHMKIWALAMIIVATLMWHIGCYLACFIYIS